MENKHLTIPGLQGCRPVSPADFRSFSAKLCCRLVQISSTDMETELIDRKWDTELMTLKNEE